MDLATALQYRDTSSAMARDTHVNQEILSHTLDRPSCTMTHPAVSQRVQPFSPRPMYSIPTQESMIPRNTNLSSMTFGSYDLYSAKNRD